MSQRALISILHIMSQLQRRWVPPLTYRTALIHCQTTPLENLNTQSAWQTFVSEAVSPAGPLAWTSSILSRIRGGVHSVAQSLHEHHDSCRQNSARYITLGEQEYPPLLSAIERPPLALSVVGSNLGLLHQNVVAVVGSRKASPRGMLSARALGQLLGDMGLCVVSGGAFGIDVAVHRGCLATDKSPVPAAVVFAGGLGHQYPKANGFMFREVRERDGLLLSEKLWHQPATRIDFPIRNRIVSGVAGVTVIVEAAETSGALITANTALEQGRDVLVLRPEQQDIRAAGNIKLIADGARHVATVEELACHIVDSLNNLSSASEGFTVC